MIVYVAAPYTHRAQARSLMKTLQSWDIDVLARWLIVEDTLDHWSAQKDLDDIDQCDAIVVLTRAGEGAGHHAEFGYALAKGKRLIVYGERTNIFHYLNNVIVVKAWEELFKALLDEAPVAAVPVVARG